MSQQKIGIIGAGAAGICAARHCYHQTPGKYDVTVFEQTTKIGGTWVYTDETGYDKNGLPIQSSMYKNLITNLPKEIMGYPDLPFPEQQTGASYISADEVLDYLNLYAKKFDLLKLIKFQHEVIRVRPILKNKWELISRNLQTNEYKCEIYDSIVICNGHFSEPILPEYPGKQLFNGLQLHSHEYRSSDQFVGKSVLVIGAGPSGLDISKNLQTCTKLVAISAKKSMVTNGVSIREPIKEIYENGVEYTNGIREEFDCILYCTGYKYDYPFLSVDCKITVTENVYVQSLYKQCININYPTMFIIGLVFRACIFRSFDLQIQFCLAHLNEPSKLPTTSEMFEITNLEMEKRFKRYGKIKFAHVLDVYQHEYFNELAELGGFDKIEPSIMKIYEDSSINRRDNFANFRRQTFKVIDNIDYSSSWLN